MLLYILDNFFLLTAIILTPIGILIYHITYKQHPGIEWFKLRVLTTFLLTLLVFFLLLSGVLIGISNIKMTKEPIKKIVVNEVNNKLDITTKSGTYNLKAQYYTSKELKFNKNKKYTLTLPKDNKYREFIKNHPNSSMLEKFRPNIEEYPKPKSKHKSTDKVYDFMESK